MNPFNYDWMFRDVDKLGNEHDLDWLVASLLVALRLSRRRKKSRWPRGQRNGTRK